jgi:putative ABC transport system permease protein
MAVKLWPGQDAIGKRFVSAIVSEKPAEVIGIVKSTKYRDGFQPLKPPVPQFYLPTGVSSPSARTFYIRTRAKPENLSREVVSEIRSIDPNIAIQDVVTMEQQVTSSLNGFGIPRLFVLIASGLGAVALLLALVGTYGALSFMVGQRSHEIGIRMALGANRSTVLKLVLGHGLGLATKSVVAGGLAGAALGRLLQIVLLNVSPVDLVVMVSAVLLLLATAFLTCLLPARKATRIDPILSLKSE